MIKPNQPTPDEIAEIAARMINILLLESWRLSGNGHFVPYVRAEIERALGRIELSGATALEMEAARQVADRVLE